MPKGLDGKIENDLLNCLREIRKDDEVRRVRANIEKLRLFRDELVRNNENDEDEDEEEDDTILEDEEDISQEIREIRENRKAAR